jgi:myo-inositol catabolism protein IolC
MTEFNDVKHVLNYLQSEITRIETVSGTLSSVEREHYKKLTNFDHKELVDIAIEEQSASRQLDTIKQMCLTMSKQIDGMVRQLDHGAGNEVH